MANVVLDGAYRIDGDEITATWGRRNSTTREREAPGAHEVVVLYSLSVGRRPVSGGAVVVEASGNSVIGARSNRLREG